MYYDGTKLLSMKDINGNVPEIYICTTNRTGGKTTYFNRLLINRFLKSGKKFALLYRFNYELDDVAPKFFKDINSLFFDEYEMTSKPRAKGIFHELLIKRVNEEFFTPCGYAISLNSSDQIKKYSHLFSDVSSILFDEFQSENNHYCNDEIKKFLSVHTSIARGQGQQVRHVPVYMISNQVSIINPYYTELGISARLSYNTNFLKGDGFVLENGFIEDASIAQKESGVNKAFKNNAYVAYAAENIYLNDNTAFIENPPSSASNYLATIRFNRKNYAIREYPTDGIVFCDERADLSFRLKITVTTEDHNINYIMLKNNDLFITQLRYLFERGAFRFKNLKCKEAILKLISL